MFLFSGTFFPLDSCPTGSSRSRWVTPLWHGVELVPRCSRSADARRRCWPSCTSRTCRARRRRLRCRAPHASRRALVDSDRTDRARRASPRAARALGAAARALRLVERNLMVYRRTWIDVFSGFFEPLFYLLSIGVGAAARWSATSRVRAASTIAYAAFVAPGAARRVGDERGDLRHDLQRLLQAELRQALRRRCSRPRSARGLAVGRDRSGR